MTITAPPAGLTIAQASEQTGLTAHTLRYYERDGLMLREVPRSSSGHRVYAEADLRWVTMLTRLRATGMSIREVKEYAELCQAGPGNESARLELLQAHRARVLAQLTEVTEHLGAIDHKIDLYRQCTLEGIDQSHFVKVLLTSSALEDVHSKP